MSTIGLNFSSLKDTKAHEYLIRFLVGGLCTAATGLIAKQFGPVIGGIFLAFPAIFPAGASLIETHERRRKSEIGSDGTKRGRIAASLDASGASLGCIGLIAFGLTLAEGLARYKAAPVITFAAVVWLVLVVSLWLLRRTRIFR